jgi:hypothetical protein
MTWTINGVDPAATYGLVLSEVAGWLDDVQETLPTVAVPGVPGLTLLSTVPVVSPRRLQASGIVQGSGATLALRAADARTKLDGLKALLARPQLSVIMADRSTRSLSADGELQVVRPPAASMIADKLPIVITLTCRDPYYYDTATTSVNPILTGVGSALPLGTAPTRPVLTIGFAATVVNPTFTLYNSSGVAVGNITLVGSFTTTDAIVIDCAAKTITLNTASRPDIMSGGDFFVLDVATLGDYASSAWPTLLRQTNVNLTVTYKKAWR